MIHGHETRNESNAKTGEHSPNDEKRQLDCSGLHRNTNAENDVSEDNAPFAPENVGGWSCGEGACRESFVSKVIRFVIGLEVDVPKNVPADKMDTTKDSWEDEMA